MERRWSTALAALFVLATHGAAAECPPYPTVAWWDNLTHENTRRYVAQVHGGDWKLYIAKWRHQLLNLESIHGRGGAGMIRSQGVRLHGEELRQYIDKVKERIAVVECLARETPVLPKYDPKAPADAGGPVDEDAPAAARSAEKSQLPGGKGTFLPYIEGRCLKDGPVFRVSNRGAPWPDQADFIVERDGQRISERRIRMATGQTVEFRVDGSGPAEIRIVPDWDPLDVRHQRIVCP
jgi:hypothetical protein